MFILKHYKGKKEISSREYITLKEAEDNIDDNFIEINDDSIESDRYDIYDTIKEKVVDEDDLESNESKIGGSMDMMFPNEDGDN